MTVLYLILTGFMMTKNGAITSWRQGLDVIQPSTCRTIKYDGGWERFDETMSCLAVAISVAIIISPVQGWVSIHHPSHYQNIHVAFPNRQLPSSTQRQVVPSTPLAASRQGSNDLPKKSRKPFKRKIDSSTHDDGKVETWRAFGINVHPDLLPTSRNGASRNNNSPSPSTTNSSVGKDYLTQPVLDALLSKLRIRHNRTASPSHLPPQLLDVRVIRRSLDARKKRGPGDPAGPRYSYVLDFDLTSSTSHALRLRPQPGQLELRLPEEINPTKRESSAASSSVAKKRVVIIGAGPAGLFCALQLARSGLVTPILLERGKPVESRGKDIGALMHRRSLDSESNFAFGEGGAGTWSDGKLTTRIGRNSEAVRYVLETFVGYGAPEKILVDGAPHLGTDNLVRLLRNMRADLRQLGGEIRFGAKMTGLQVDDGKVTGVEVKYSAVAERTADVEVFEGSEIVSGDAVVLATGHSARDVYEELHQLGVKLEAKGFAVGFRVEHPQSIINKIQYGTEWGKRVLTGKVSTDTANEHFFATAPDDSKQHHEGELPVPSYRLATDKANDGATLRGVYSFCMCPGGQVVPASTNTSEVCVNGMSFSRRDSLWANSALVVTVSPDDVVLDEYRPTHGIMAGLAFQRDMEQRASRLGGGNLTVPVQRLTDFVAGIPSTSAPPSSYRLGVKPAACHEIFPQPLVQALRDAVVNHFEPQMPGFLTEEALLHAVETRTSSPLRVSRDSKTFQAVGIEGLFPAGEGAGFAGGIVSAAVDGMVVAEGVLDLVIGDRETEQGSILQKKATSLGFDY